MSYCQGTKWRGTASPVVPSICQPQQARDREARPGFDRRRRIPSRASSLNALSWRTRSGRELTRSRNITKCLQQLQSVAGSTFSAQRHRASVAKNGQQAFGTHQRCTLTHATYRQAGDDMVTLRNKWECGISRILPSHRVASSPTSGSAFLRVKAAIDRQWPIRNRWRFGAPRGSQSLSSAAATFVGTSRGRRRHTRLASDYSRIRLPTLDQFSRRDNMLAKKAIDTTFQAHTKERLFGVDVLVSRSQLPRRRRWLFIKSHAPGATPEQGAKCFSAGTSRYPIAAIAESFRILSAADSSIGQIPQSHFCGLPAVPVSELLAVQELQIEGPRFRRPRRSFRSSPA
jgi:hypothetical protein